MKTYLITPPEAFHDLQVVLPPSKSISNRALLIRALANSDATLENLADCEDTQAMLSALNDNPTVVDVGAAGTAMRFLTAYYAMKKGETHILTGTARMKKRPIMELVEALTELGADIEYVNEVGFPPLRIRGKELTGGLVELPGNISSQFVSALLMVGPFMKKTLQVSLQGEIYSSPYINMTMSMMTEFGADVKWGGRNLIICQPKPYTMKDYWIEPDWSAASYWFEIASFFAQRKVAVDVTLKDLPMYGSIQGDKDVDRLYTDALRCLKYDEENAIIRSKKRWTKIDLLRCDFSQVPDLAQTLVVTCCMLNTPILFYGLESLWIKETNRMNALKNELGKLGYDLYEDGLGTLLWQNGKHEPEDKPVIETYNDHRMAMAFAPCCILLGEIRIANPDVVNKSYPHYWDDLRKAGFNIEEIDC